MNLYNRCKRDIKVFLDEDFNMIAGETATDLLFFMDIKNGMYALPDYQTDRTFHPAVWPRGYFYEIANTHYPT